MKPTERGRGARLPALAAALLLAALVPGPVRAQFTPIQPGQTVEAVLTATDPLPTTRGPFKVYQFSARRGDRLTATMRSTDFDSYLRVGRELGGITDELDADDDAGGNTDARVRFTAPEDGAYLLIAQALEEEGRGTFTLTLEPTPAPTTAEPQPIRIGETVTAALAETDAIQEDDETYYDTWTVDATSGQRLIVVMEAAGFDAFLSIGRTQPDGEFDPVASNDDGDQAGDSTNARMRVRIPEAGTYEIRANSVGPSTGPYRLTVLEGPQPAAVATRQPITPGEEMESRLDEADAVLDDDAYYEYWTYPGRAGERLTIRMSSEDFDTVLAFGRLVNGAFDEIDTNDDARPDVTDSELEVALARDGDYVIRASAFGPGIVGDYAISVTRGR